MKRIQQITLIALVMLSSIGATFAQRGMQGQNPGAHFEQMIQRMTEHLGLTDQQVSQLTQVHDQFAAELKTVREGDLKPEDKREAMRALRQEMKSETEAILTEEQLNSWGEFGPHSRRNPDGKSAMSQEERLERKENRLQMKEELISYRQENITPVLLTKRLELEEELSNSEKQQISEVRNQLTLLKSQKGQGQEKGKGLNNPSGMKRQGNKCQTGPGKNQGKRRADCANATPSGRKGPAGAREAGPGVHRIARMLERKAPESYSEMQVLAEKYSTEIAGLWMDIEDQHQQWRSDNQQIREKYLPEGAEDRSQRQRQGRADKPEIRHETVEKQALNKKIAFLLMPIDAPDSQDGEEDAMQLDIFPNPSRTWNSISFRLDQREKVLIELIDEKGNVVKEITDQKMSGGQHKVDVDLSGLGGNTYYYRITTKDQVKTARFLKLQE